MTTVGFSDTQKKEMKEILVTVFRDVVLPGLDIKRKVTDLENDTVSAESYRKLVRRVEVLERKLAI